MLIAFALLSWIDEWARSSDDKVLADLCSRLMSRQLFKAIVVPHGTSGSTFASNLATLRDLVRRTYGSDDEWYLLEDTVIDVAFKGYLANLTRGKPADHEEIWFIGDRGQPRLLSEYDGVLTQEKRALEFREDRWFVPEDVAEQASGALHWD